MRLVTTVLQPLSVAVLLAGLVGCTHPRPIAAKRVWTPEEIRAESDRAFLVEREADLVIDFERPDQIRLRTSGHADSTSTTEQDLAAAIATVNPKKGLAVVILGKPMRHQFDEPELGMKVVEIQAALQAQGFKRIVFLIAAASGQSFYRE